MIERISPEEAKAKLDSDDGYIYLDVRDVSEYAAGHPPGAHNVPILQRGVFGMSVNKQFLAVCEANYAKDQKIITGCLRGMRSLKAAETLVSAGYTNVVDMLGGLDAELGPGGEVVYEGWARRGLPVTATPNPGATYAELMQKA